MLEEKERNMISAASSADQRMLLSSMQIIFKVCKVLLIHKDLDCNPHTQLSRLDVSLCEECFLFYPNTNLKRIKFSQFQSLLQCLTFLKAYPVLLKLGLYVPPLTQGSCRACQRALLESQVAEAG